MADTVPGDASGKTEEVPPPPPPPANGKNAQEGAAKEAPKLESVSGEEKQKRDAAQALLAGFMSGKPAKKRKLEEEEEPLAIDMRHHADRRRRILAAAKACENSLGPPGSVRAPQPHNPMSAPPTGFPPQASNHIMTGAGQYNKAEVPLPPAMFQRPPWLGQASQKYYFEVYAGPQEKVNRIPIWKDRLLVVGRQPDCNIVVNHGLVSRRHAVIGFHQHDGAPMLFDVGSTHGTYLNDMTNKIPVNDGLVDRKEWKKLEVDWRIMFGKCAYQYALKSEGPNPDFKPGAEHPPNEPEPASNAATPPPDLQPSGLAPGVHPSRAARFQS